MEKLIQYLSEEERRNLASKFKYNLEQILKNQHGTFFFQRFLEACTSFATFEEIAPQIIKNMEFLELCTHEYSNHAIRILVKRIPDALILQFAPLMMKNFA